MYPTGCIYLPKVTAAYVAERTLAGIPADVGALKIDGWWRHQIERGVFEVFAGDADRELRGQESPVRSQARGTCCSQGMAGACQDTITLQIVDYARVGYQIDIAAEPIYGGGRVDIGRGSYGWKDGLAVVHAARFVHQYGLLNRGVVGGYDLSHEAERYAVDWAAGNGVPRPILEACDGHQMRACNKVESDRELADVTAAGYMSAMGSTHQFSDRRDSNGMCSYKGPTAHCEQTSGVFVLPSWDGNLDTVYRHTGIVRRQSWAGVPTGPDVLRYYNGRTYKLRRGEYGITLAAAYAALRTMETWCVGDVQETWRS